jgi:hypothetical protein
MLRPVHRIRYAALCALGGILIACPAEPQLLVPSVDGGTVAIAGTLTSTRTHTTHTATIAVVTPPPPPPSVGPCERAPKWVGRPPCVEDGFLYAAGELPSKSASFLARSTAANRARRRLAQAMGAHDNDRFTLNNSEIDQIYACGGSVHALARVPSQNLDIEFKKCGDAQLAPAPAAEGCPDWTGRMAWREGDTFYSVVPSAKAKQRQLAERAALNRARQVASEMVEVELQLSPKGVKSFTKGSQLQQKGRTTAECNGARWFKVAFQKGA